MSPALIWAAGTAPLVSVCTITRNRPALLALLAEGVAAQAYPAERLEWVVIDDSGPGPDPDLAAAHQAGIAVKLVRLLEPHPIGAKRNLCHEHASGELLVLMDDDDYYPPTRVPEAVATLIAGEGEVAGCPRMHLLLLPEGSRWLTPSFHVNDATANSLAYRRSYVEAGHSFDPEAWQAEEVSFLEEFATPLLRLDPALTLTCIGHGSNTVDKRLWIARNGEHRFERLPADAPGFPPEDWLRRYCGALGLPGPEPARADPAQNQPAQPPLAQPRPWRVAVITPYHNEPLELLQRCHFSVLKQEVACTHVLVADGPGHSELAGWNCRHIVLGVPHGDIGNTPRGLGALAAMNEGFDCIAFLDVDNWWAPDHLRRAIATQAECNFSVVFAARYIVFPDGRRLTRMPEEDLAHSLADTSAMVLFEESFSSLSLWAQIPSLLAQNGDRVVFSQLMASHRCGWVNQPTVYYETWWLGHFLAAGLLPPLNAKFLHRHPQQAWFKAAEQFRHRSPTPVHLPHDLVGSSKARLNLVSILGPSCSGGTLLQSGLCRHFGYAGIPENQFLCHYVSCFGPDHQRRIDGAELQQLLASHQPSHPLAKAHDLRPSGLEQAIRPGRSYTMLEAYFRVIQALTPPAALEFSCAWGQVTVLERSSTLALVAEALYRCLPEHRAVLMVRDPLAQIASVRRLQQRYPEAWGHATVAEGMVLQRLSQTYLQSLAIPLTAAPPGQLKLVRFEQLQAAPELVIQQVSAFLGLEPSPYLALEPPLAVDCRCFNDAPELQWRNLVAALPQQLLRGEPWKQHCLLGMPGEGKPACTEGLDSLSGEERQLLSGWFEPLQQALAWLAELGRSPNAEPPVICRPDSCEVHELTHMAAEVGLGLVRHGLALRRPDL